MLIDDIALTMHPEVGCRTVIHLLEHFGSAEQVYAATEQELCREAGLKPAVARSILNRETHLRAQKEWEFVTRRRLRVLTSNSAAYPVRLRECGDYPHVLYVSGDLDFNRGHWLSVVGTRKMTSYGSRMCETMIGELAQRVPDLVIVSGLAYGVDVAAHRAALKYGVPTVGVLGHPITRIYPPAHTDTARRMVLQGGAVLSEFASDEEPSRAGFVQRNRVIAGLSEGTLIVESAARGGSLITADMADGYHRTLMAIPGRVGDLYSEGTNRLIRTLKAQMVCGGQDILEAMNWDVDLAERGERDQQTVEAPFKQPERPLQEEPGSFDEASRVSKRSVGPDRRPSLRVDLRVNRGAVLRPDLDAVSGQVSGTDPVDISGTALEEGFGVASKEGSGAASKRVSGAASEKVLKTILESDSESGRITSERRSIEGSDVRSGNAEDEEVLSSAARRLLELIDRDEAIGWDELVLKAPFPSADLALLLLDLEFQGRICSLPGNRYLKC